ncbi:MAG TPA: Hpt domain-containing protein [Steroidobacteraceae bacterium]|nr:Hpt domain-containing protein [Steroidobacteraceae bacterium]
MPEVASQTLDLVGRELNAALAEARTALETYVEQPDNVSLLERCKQELHQVHGVLRVLEIYGAALLAEEMEQVAGYLLATVTERKGQAESLDALLRAMVQLPGYLERVLAGGRDLALVLLPLLNDLRAVRGSSLLSEGTLLLLNLKSDKQAQPVAVATDEPPLNIEQWSRRLRARFQMGLIGWIRGERIQQNLETLASVSQKLEQTATRQPVFQLWWVVGAVVEALRENGLEGGQSIKRLLGLADREIRRLYELGEARYCQVPPVELLNNLLYYVGRAESTGTRVSAVRASFRLAELLPVDESIEQERESLSAPSVKLMQTVAAAIREDLSKVKDVLDIFVRRGAGQPQELSPQVELLRKIGDTLGVLGLGDLRATVQAQTEKLEKIVAGSLKADETTLVEVAAALIGVEDRLDDGLVGMILPRVAASSQQGEDHDFQQVQSAVLRECILNLARIKEAVTQSVGGTLDAAGLDSWQELMRGLKAALLILGKTRAVEVIEAITTQLKRVMRPGALVLPSGFLDRLADAIVSVEYYMETLQAGRSDPWYMLDNALGCVQALEQQQTVSVPTVPPLEPATFAKTVQIPAPHPMDATHVVDVSGTEPDLGAQGLPVLTPSAVARVAAVAENADPELLKLFIEEAREELVKIERGFPVWEQNPLEREALVTVRRSFHTLKGSGRMVGARELGELSWAVENLLNRVLDNTLSRSPAILEVLRDAIAALPQMIEHLENASPVAADVAGIAARAHALAAGKQPVPTSRHTTTRVPADEAAQASDASPAPMPGESLQADASNSVSLAAEVPTPPAEPQPVMEAAAEPVAPAPQPPLQGASPAAMDEALREIYTRETGAHVATIRNYLKRESLSTEPHLLPEDVYRACHTLAGSSKMAQARHGVRLAEPLDHWLRRAFTSGIGLRSSDLTLLADSMGAMESVAAHLDEPTGYFVNHWQLLERLGEAERALDARIAEASRAGSRGEERPQTPGSGVPADGPLSEHDEQGAPDVPPEPVVPEAVIEEPPDFDPEVAAIFTEEALELIDASEHALSDWRDKPSSPESATALKRPLHTLKGGARMAGIIAMGDLSHELETLVIQAENGTVAVDGAAFDVIQASLDELARMRESVANGRRVAPARAMIARIQALTRPGGAPVAVATGTQGPKQDAPVPVAVPTTSAAPASAATPSEAASPSSPVIPAGPTPAAARSESHVPSPVAPSQPHQAENAAADASAGESVELAAELQEPPLLAAAAEADTPPPSAPTEQAPTEQAPTSLAQIEPAHAEPAPILSSAPPPAADQHEFSASEAVPSETHAPEGPADEVLAAPQPVPPGREPVAPVERQEMARVDAELLDKLLNISGEASIARSRLEQQLGSIDFNLGELSRTVTRLKEQLRSLEIETEAQILHRHEDEGGHRSEFDPLELDRYSSIQQFSRALAETANDVASIQQLLENLAKDAQNLLQQQARTITELQNGLMRTRMVPFQRHVQRLARIVRQAASDTGKRAELVVEGASGELDRQVLERMLPPFEHMLRNAVVHGIETPEERTRRGKPPAGRILLELHREGAEVMVRLTDDGGGMNLEAIRAKGRTLGLIPPGRALSDEDAMQLILEPGFSTAGALTQQAGRGVGMDVVATEIKRLGGALHMETKAGEGSVFTIRLPFTLAISHALVVRTGEEFYALPLPTVEGVLRLSKAEVSAHLGRDAAMFDYGGQKYRFQHLAVFVGLEPLPLPEQDVTIPVVLVRAGEHSTGLVADELVGSREIVVKSVGPQISGIRGISGATILGDGRIVIILDIGALVRAEWRGRGQLPPVQREDRRTFALVVDDSITVRRVTQRLLERNGMRVLTARDGMDAIAMLQDHVPDIILLDIEMPRMDGYEVAAHVRNDSRLKDVPIIMITSRVGEKHRARAIELGVDDYLGKPYQEAELLDAITPLVERRRAAQDSALQDVPRQAEGR